MKRFLMFFHLTVVFITLFSLSAMSAPVSTIQGTNWKNECAEQGGNLRGCCQGKESACQDGCQVGEACGNACTQCKNDCRASYNVCVKARTSQQFTTPGTPKQYIEPTTPHTTTVPPTRVPLQPGTLKTQ